MVVQKNMEQALLFSRYITLREWDDSGGGGLLIFFSHKTINDRNSETDKYYVCSCN